MPLPYEFNEDGVDETFDDIDINELSQDNIDFMVSRLGFEGNYDQPSDFAQDRPTEELSDDDQLDFNEIPEKELNSKHCEQDSKPFKYIERDEMEKIGAAKIPKKLLKKQGLRNPDAHGNEKFDHIESRSPISKKSYTNKVDPAEISAKDEIKSISQNMGRVDVRFNQDGHGNYESTSEDPRVATPNPSMPTPELANENLTRSRNPVVKKTDGSTTVCSDDESPPPRNRYIVECRSDSYQSSRDVSPLYGPRERFGAFQTRGRSPSPRSDERFRPRHHFEHGGPRGDFRSRFRVEGGFRAHGGLRHGSGTYGQTEYNSYQYNGQIGGYDRNDIQHYSYEDIHEYYSDYHRDLQGYRADPPYCRGDRRGGRGDHRVFRGNHRGGRGGRRGFRGGPRGRRGSWQGYSERQGYPIDRRDGRGGRHDHSGYRRSGRDDHLGYSGNREDNRGDRRDYRGERGYYRDDRRGSLGDRQGYSSDRQGYSSDHRLVRGDRQDYRADRQGYSGDRRDCRADRRGSPGDRQVYRRDCEHCRCVCLEYLADRRGHADRSESRGIASQAEFCEADQKSKQCVEDKHANDPLYCIVCKVRVSSKLHMDAHLSGSPHNRKLKQFGFDAGTPLAEAAKAINTLEGAGEYLEYRKANGVYYCDSCNVELNHITALKLHLNGRKHLHNNK